MVVISLLPRAVIGPNDRQEDGPHFRTKWFSSKRFENVMDLLNTLKDGISDFVDNADCIAVLFILFTLGLVKMISLIM